MNDLEIGQKRLAKVFQESFRIQNLTLRPASYLTKKLYKTGGVGTVTINRIKQGNTDHPQPGTLEKLAVLVFRVSHFECINDDPVGKPIFAYQGAIYTPEKTMKLLAATKLTDIPDLNFRYKTHGELEKILNNDVNAKTLYLDSTLHASDQKKLVKVKVSA